MLDGIPPVNALAAKFPGGALVEARTFAKLFVIKGLGNSFGKYPLASRAGSDPVGCVGLRIRGIDTIATGDPFSNVRA